MSGSIVRRCEACGKEFRTKPSKVKLGFGRFCSRTCFRSGCSEVRTCQTCGAEFKVDRCVVLIGEGKFCSRKCVRRSDPIERFWSKVDKDGPVPSHMPHLGQCWIWNGTLAHTGYGRFKVPGEHPSFAMAHRFAFKIANGSYPTNLAMHMCDNPRCVNPSHLVNGTYADNGLDMKLKGRGALGKRNGKYTLPERTPRGDRNGARTHPERLLRGAQHPCYGSTATRGSANPTAKLVESQVIEIRNSHEKQRILAERYGVSIPLISAIQTRRLWKHL
jgi:hypothetical protein